MRRKSTRRRKTFFAQGDVVVIDFPGVTGVKRRPTVVVSSAVYHASRPDVVVGLITSQTTALGPTDYRIARLGAGGPARFLSLSQFFCHPASCDVSSVRRPPVGPRLAGGMRVCTFGSRPA